jgi:hypothetical protein
MIRGGHGTKSKGKFFATPPRENADTHIDPYGATHAQIFYFRVFKNETIDETSLGFSMVP